MSDPVVIVSAARTPMGSFQGTLSPLSTTDLGAVAIKAAVTRAGIAAEDVQEVMMGCVLPAGLGQAPARQAAIKGGLPLSAGCTTVNKVCGSGMKTVMLAHDALLAGSVEIIVAGGMESMTNAPYLLPKARGGMRMGHGTVVDHMFMDGLEDAYFDKGGLMGTFAENTADKYAATREEQDAFAIESLNRARKASETGLFKDEIEPLTVKHRKGETFVEQDEQPYAVDTSKIPNLRPAFRPDGTVTAASSSSISDGAAAVVLMRQSEATRRGLKPLATIKAHATHSQEPCWFTTAPVGAISKALDKAGWTSEDVDLYEINEAFAIVTMAAMKELNLPHKKVNVHGGACALGHPIGASGTRLIVTLIHALKQTGGTKGIASLCIGGGEATALAVELI
ncbi:acetyl-CoA C-acyltransferase [Kiloniella laminariae]|uniref:Acetyl-CoA C-acyltransferase n=1 Tax=Kiloniella laminariae TaxID=454162 RepID=A0ABT4LMY8_9PROT|nr:acetyl-CoA C-acyltransferase [Kiloniella laminariae]MCZ4282515.1 acetyl-CoA C-acyltransferase [Kiloniella laminariae]